MTYSVRVVHSGSDPIGKDITRDHAFFTVAHWVSGKPVDQLEVGETCKFEAHTADGRVQIGRKTQWIQYMVGRVS